MQKIRILLVDDHTLVRQGLISLLRPHEDLLVVAETGTGLESVTLARKTKPDIVIMDFGLPDITGLEAASRIWADCPRVKIVILSMHTHKALVQGAKNAGVSGYLVKECAATELVNAIRSVMKGQCFWSPKAMAVLSACQSGSGLTSRECEVLALNGAGLRAKDIAERLGIRVRTVYKHFQDIMDRLNIRTLQGLAAFAVKEGFTSNLHHGK
jgi:DNA-binding NarL/FixJ family response regulator